MESQLNYMMKESCRIIGYARVSTEDQHLDLQIDALKLAGCSTLFEDRGISATAKRRPGFERALSSLQAGDVFVVWKMDRAFRSLKNALDILEEFENRAIEFRCLTEDIDTTTPMGKCMYQIRHAFSELERNLIRERTKAGMEAARQRGAHLGRPKKLSRSQIIHMQGLLQCEPNITPVQMPINSAYLPARSIVHCHNLPTLKKGWRTMPDKQNKIHHYRPPPEKVR